MPTTLNIQDILSQIRQLGIEEQYSLLERIVALVKKNGEATDPLKLVSISGLGSEVWNTTNIDQYIDEERQW